MTASSKARAVGINHVALEGFGTIATKQITPAEPLHQCSCSRRVTIQKGFAVFNRGVHDHVCTHRFTPYNLRVVLTGASALIR